MIFQKHYPKYPLDKYVESIIYLEGNNKGIGLPKTAMSMVFNLGDHFKLFTDNNFIHFKEYKKYWIAGLQSKPTQVESFGNSKMILVQFKTFGAFVFLPEPLYHYTDTYVTLDHLYQKEADETWERLQEASNIHEKFLLIENFLYRKLLTNRFINQKMVDCAELLLNGTSQMTIHQISKQMHISRKHLNHVVKDWTGVSPKMLTSLYRFQSTLKKICASKPETLTELAYQMDYFDQAHFNKDFKRFTNLKPSEYIYLSEHTPSLKIVPHFIPFK